MSNKGFMGSMPSGASGDKPLPAEICLYKRQSETSFVEAGKIPCMFRPTELSISKSVRWGGDSAGANEKAGGTIARLNVPEKHFSGGDAAKLTLNLFFDTTDTGKDVRETTDRLFELVLIDKDTVETSPTAPYCRFKWGTITSFMSMVTSVSVKYTLFLSDGTPVRAEATLSLEQAVDETKLTGQNPTSFSEARKLRVVTEGETLDWIACQEYGDSAQWRHIAQANDLLNPRDLQSGQLLKLTPLP
jgi:hypothetical protein